MNDSPQGLAHSLKDNSPAASGIFNWMHKEPHRKMQKWCSERPVRICVLFGSQATGKAHDKSDFDLAIWPKGPLTPTLKLRWLMELETHLDRPVSLVIVSPDLSPVLGFEIVRDGRLLFESQAGSWEKAHRQLWHAFQDSLPFRRAARQQLSQFAEGIRRGA